MNRFRFLKIVFLLSVAAVLFLPVYTTVFLYPAFTGVLMQDTEEEAVRLAEHLSGYFNHPAQNLDRLDITPFIIEEISGLIDEKYLEKVKVFSAEGEVIYSTDPDDIGTVNEKLYFHDVVLTGNNFTKIVKKDSRTLEDRLITVDVVETYVPVMNAGKVIGAFEIYYDITERKERLDGLVRRSTAIVFVIAAVLLAAVIVSLRKLYLSIRGREQVERELAWHRDQLEVMVRERTLALLEANRRLKADIEQREQAEKALRESEEKYRLLVESANDAIIVMDAGTGTILNANQRSAELFGRAPDEIIGQHRSILHPESEWERYHRLYDNLARAGKGCLEDLHVRRGDGHLVPVEVSASLSEWEGRSIIQCILRDVSDRLKAAEELQRVQRLESTGVLAGGIAHDFNNLLTAILGNISLARLHRNLPERVRTRLMETEKAALRARDLTSQLLTFARGGEPDKKIVHVAGIIREASELVLRGRGVTCRYELPDDLCPVEGDAGQLNQVFHNLLINAVQAMPDGGTITVHGENYQLGELDRLPLENGKYLRLSIIDDGKGIHRHDLNRIFDPYYTTKEDGTGLGLSSAYSIIKKHAGHITVESRYGRGAVFTVYLPASERRPPGTAEISEEAVYTGQGRLLVMDDEEMVREVATELLTGLGYEVELAADGMEAVGRYEEALGAGRPFAAVIMDLTVPGGIGGREALERLRDIDPGVRALVSSGYSRDRVLSNYREYGFCGVVPKPYKLEELSRVLHEVLDVPEK